MTHWTEREITHWLYGLVTDTTHLEECSECRERTEAAAALRKKVTAPPEVSWEFLAAQRRAIYRRMDRPQPLWLRARWIASVAMLLFVAVFSLTFLKQPAAVTPLESPADAKLYSDLVAIDQSNEPKAVAPIEKLFEQ